MSGIVVGPAVVALDDLLCDAPPEYWEALRRYRDQHPTPFQDQYRAAASDIKGVVDGNTARRGGRVLDALRMAEHPGWVRLGLLHALMGWLVGEAATCTHAPVPDLPQPVVAAAWKPGLVVCNGCHHLLRVPPLSVADRTCDGCGHVTTPVEQGGDGIGPCMVLYGPFVYAFGVCGNCRYLGGGADV